MSIYLLVKIILGIQGIIIILLVLNNKRLDKVIKDGDTRLRALEDISGKIDKTSDGRGCWYPARPLKS